MSSYEDLVERIERLEKENREVCQLMASTIIAVMENSNRDLPVNQNNVAEDSETTSGCVSGGKTFF